MTRAKRLPRLIDLLRAGPVSVSKFAIHFGKSTKTFYADIRHLRNQGHPVESTSDGFLLQTAAALAPTFFNDHELQAILTGLAWVAADEDSEFSEVAISAVTKVESLLPSRHFSSTPLLRSDDPLDIVRSAIEHERKLELAYRDAKGRPTNRIIWPLQLEAYDETAIIAAWCEQRSDFRNFRLDRIQSLQLLNCYPTRRQTLLARFHLQQEASGW